MIVIAGKIPVRADRREEAIQAALDMQKATQAEEGCISYRFNADLEHPNDIFIFEEWESQEHLNAHFNTPHMKVFRSIIPNVVAGPGTLKRYVIESVGPL